MHTRAGSKDFEPSKIKEAELADKKTSVELVSNADADAYFFRALEGQRGIKLNQSQMDAVRHHHGTALVLAGAGSGKTSVLTSRAGYLLSVHKVNPANLLLITFTRKAAAEMKERIALLPGLSHKMVSDITVGTFHAIFLRLLRAHGYEQQILNNDKYKQSIIKIILKNKGLQDAYEPETLLSRLSAYKMRMMSAYDLPENEPIDIEIKHILLEFEKWKDSNSYIDYDDILLRAYQLLTDHPSVLRQLQTRFTYVMVDEWQDTNPIQYALIQKIAAPENNLFCVGDDDQTIYSFNGADSTIILNFDKEYPNTKVITLDVNYRSNTPIVGLANDVIALNKQRHKKTLKATRRSTVYPYFSRPENGNQEAERVIDSILDEVETDGRSLRDFAILYRTFAASRAIFDKLVLQGIPIITYSQADTFYEQSLVAPIIDHLRLSLDPQNIEAIERILPSLYLSREKTMDYIREQVAYKPEANLLHLLLRVPQLQPFQKKHITERVTLIKRLKNMKPVVAIKEIRTFYEKFLSADKRKNLTYDKGIILETLSEVEESAKGFDSTLGYVSFVNVIIEKNKEMEERRRIPDIDAIHLSTIHGAKGLEYPVVHVIGVIEDIIPHRSALQVDESNDIYVNVKSQDKQQKALEEERRLLYVAITRAKERLHLYAPKYYRSSVANVSRFLLEPYPAPVTQTEAKPRTGSAKAHYTPRRQESKTHTPALVWDCTNSNCIAWMRITNAADHHVETRKCPMCRSDMVKVHKMV